MPGPTGFLALLLAAVLILGSGCATDDDRASGAGEAATTQRDDRAAVPPDEPDDGERQRTEMAEEPTEGPPPVTTSPAGGGNEEQISQAVYERSLSECASFDVERLAAKYKVQRDAEAIALAVGRGWAEQFGGRDRSARAGRDGCLQGLQTR